METSASTVQQPAARDRHAAQPPATQSAATPSADADQTPARLDLSALEPPRRLAEARLEDVTIDGICGVY